MIEAYFYLARIPSHPLCVAANDVACPMGIFFEFALVCGICPSVLLDVFVAPCLRAIMLLLALVLLRLGTGDLSLRNQFSRRFPHLDLPKLSIWCAQCLFSFVRGWRFLVFLLSFFGKSRPSQAFIGIMCCWDIWANLTPFRFSSV